MNVRQLLSLESQVKYELQYIPSSTHLISASVGMRTCCKDDSLPLAISITGQPLLAPNRDPLSQQTGSRRSIEGPLQGDSLDFVENRRK